MAAAKARFVALSEQQIEFLLRLLTSLTIPAKMVSGKVVWQDPEGALLIESTQKALSVPAKKVAPALEE